MARQELSDTQIYREKQGSVYAWSHMAKTLTERHFMAALHNTDGHFVAVDLCSSHPIYREVLNSYYSSRTLRYALRLMAGFFEAVKSPDGIQQIKDLTGEEDANVRRLVYELGHDRPRRVMGYSIYSTAVSPPVENTQEAIRDRLLDMFLSSKSGYLVRKEPEGNIKRGIAWDAMLKVDFGFTLKDIRYIIGEENAVKFLNMTANYFAERVLGRLRDFSSLSLDIEDFQALVRQASRSSPMKYTWTRLFHAANMGSRHIRGDVKALPFSEESISYYSCIEGWPFYGGDFTTDEQVSIAQQVGRTLVPGGRAIFFPWRIKGEAESKRLSIAEDTWKKQGLWVVRFLYSRSELLKDMTSREYHLTNRSPVFAEGDSYFTLLVVEKPRSAKSS